MRKLFWKIYDSALLDFTFQVRQHFDCHPVDWSQRSDFSLMNAVLLRGNSFQNTNIISATTNKGKQHVRETLIVNIPEQLNALGV